MTLMTEENNHNCGNIVVSGCDSDEMAISAKVVMLSSIQSRLKYAVHIIPIQ